MFLFKFLNICLFFAEGKGTNIFDFRKQILSFFSVQNVKKRLFVPECNI